MYSIIYNLINEYGILQMASYRKQVAVVAEVFVVWVKKQNSMTILQ